MPIEDKNVDWTITTLRFVHQPGEERPWSVEAQAQRPVNDYDRYRHERRARKAHYGGARLPDVITKSIRGAGTTQEDALRSLVARLLNDHGIARDRYTDLLKTLRDTASQHPDD